MQRIGDTFHSADCTQVLLIAYHQLTAENSGPIKILKNIKTKDMANKKNFLIKEIKKLG